MVYVGVHLSRQLKEKLALDTDKQLQIISNVMLIKTVRYAINKLKNKAVLHLNIIVCIALWT